MNRPGPLAWLTQLSYTYLPTHTHTHTHTHTRKIQTKKYFTPAWKNRLTCLKKYQFLTLVWKTTQPANIGPQDVPTTSPSNVPRTSPKDPIWPSRGRPNLTSWRRPNLTFKGHPWEVVSGRPQEVLRTSPRGPSKHSNLDVPKFFLTFLSELIRLTKSI